MRKLLGVIEEAKTRYGCMVSKEEDLYRVRGSRYALSEFIGWIETDGYTVYIHEGPEEEEDSILYSQLVQIVKD